VIFPYNFCRDFTQTMLFVSSKKKNDTFARNTKLNKKQKHLIFPYYLQLIDKIPNNRKSSPASDCSPDPASPCPTPASSMCSQ
jgi:hypothetical protein